MVCLMMFKTLFTVNNNNPSPNKNSPRSTNGRLWRMKKSLQPLPEIETGATITGIRTMIREKGRTRAGSSEMNNSPSTNVQAYA